MKKLFALILVAVIALCCFAGCGGNEVVNPDGPLKVAKGDSVTYTLSISDSHQNVAGMHVVLFYDRDVFTLDSAETPDFSGSSLNLDENENGQVVFTNALINGADGLACKEKASLVSATFVANKDAETEISYYIPYIYDIDMVNIQSYCFTCDIDIDGNAVSEDAVPVLKDVSGIEGFDKGDFKNSVSGRS